MNFLESCRWQYYRSELEIRFVLQSYDKRCIGKLNLKMVSAYQIDQNSKKAEIENHKFMLNIFAPVFFK